MAPWPLTSDDIYREKNYVTPLKETFFLPTRLKKLSILVAYKFLTKNLNLGSVSAFLVM